MTSRSPIRAGFAPRLPGRVRAGSPAFFRRATTLTARQDMAQIIKTYERIVRKLDGLTPAALRDALQPVFDKSQVYVPKRTGALAQSGQLNVSTNAEGNAEGEITYGSSSVWYAALVHELVHLRHEPPTRAKYLQAALEEELDAFLVSLATDYALGLR